MMLLFLYNYLDKPVNVIDNKDQVVWYLLLHLK